MATYSTAQEWELITVTGTTGVNSQTTIVGPGHIDYDSSDGYQYMVVSARSISNIGGFTNTSANIVICRSISSPHTQYGVTQLYNLFWVRNTSDSARHDGVFQYNINDGSAISMVIGVLTHIESGTHSPVIPSGFYLMLENQSGSGPSTTWEVKIARFK